MPEASISLYRAKAPWSSFGTIVALTDEDGFVKVKADEDGIWNAKATTDENGVVYYGTQGRPNKRPYNGINIIRYSDGSTKEVLIK